MTDAFGKSLTELEKIGVLYLEISDIDKQIAGLYSQKKQYLEDIKSIYETMLEKTRNGETIFEEK